MATSTDTSAAAKRLTSLTGYMLALFLAAGSIGLYRLDAEDYRVDAQALLRLQSFNAFLEANPVEELRPPLRRAARLDLARADPALDEARLAARTALVHKLITGLEGQAPIGCAFFSENVVEGKIATIRSGVRRPDVALSLLKINSAFLDPPPAETELAERGTVGFLLTRLDQFFAPVAVEAVTNIGLEQTPDPCIEENRLFEAGQLQPRQRVNSPETWRPPFESAILHEGRVWAEFAGVRPFEQHQQRQLREERATVQLQVETKMAGLKSSADLLASGRSALVRDLRALWRRDSAKERLSRDYGFLPIDYAVSTAGSALVQGFAGATILGLKLSHRRIAVIVAAATLGLALLIARECRLAGRSGASLRDPAPEGPRAQLVNLSLGRLAAWAGAPAAAILFVGPHTPVWFALAGAAAAIGSAAFLWSRRSYAA